MFGIQASAGLLVALVILVFIIANSIKILPEYERGVVFRLGRLRPTDYGPGIFFLIPIADRMVRVSLRTVVHDVPPQDIITRDNVSVKVNAVVYYRVMNPRRAVVDVENFHYATSQLSQTTLRSVLGQVELDTLLSEREKLNQQLQTILDKHTDPWGIKVSAVEVKHVDLPAEMQRAMAKQAEAEREKRAKIIHADGERQAATALSAAADIFGQNPVTLQLRYLQTLTEVASEKNSTLIFPLPIELLKPFLRVQVSDRRAAAPVKPAAVRKPRPRRVKEPSAPSAPDVLAAALAVSQCLELEAQLHAFLEVARGWAAAVDGVGFGPDPEAPGLAPLTTTMAADDIRLDALRHAVRSRGEKDWAEGAFPLAADGVRALAVPLRTDHDAAVGAIVLLDPARDAAAALTELAHSVRPAVGNAMQVRAIRELTIKDDTASCYNRRYFEEFILEEMSRANRFKTPMSLIFFDMDNLKEVNTRLGHAAGSRTLLEVSERVRGKIRKFDKLFRFGGDEFCIVLPETEWHGATEVAERVRETISGRPFLMGTPWAQGAQPMTASFGIASFPLHARTKEELVQRADRAMQSVKTTTKNGIATAERRRDPDAS